MALVANTTSAALPSAHTRQTQAASPSFLEEHSTGPHASRTLVCEVRIMWRSTHSRAQDTFVLWPVPHQPACGVLLSSHHRQGLHMVCAKLQEADLQAGQGFHTILVLAVFIFRGTI